MQEFYFFQELRDLLAECMRFGPHQRPSIEDLQKYIRQGRRTVEFKMKRHADMQGVAKQEVARKEMAFEEFQKAVQNPDAGVLRDYLQLNQPSGEGASTSA